MAVIAVSPWAAAALAGFAIAGCGFSWDMTGLSTLVQGRAPDELAGPDHGPLAGRLRGIAPGGRRHTWHHRRRGLVRTAFVVAAVVTLAVALLCRPRVLARPGLVPLRH